MVVQPCIPLLFYAPEAYLQMLKEVLVDDTVNRHVWNRVCMQNGGDSLYM